MKRLISIISVFFCASLLVSCVEDLEVTVEFNQPVYEISVGDTLDLTAEVKVENTLKSPVFSSSDKKVAEVVSAGRLVALDAGETVITAEVEGKSATAQLKVSLVAAESISIESPESVTPGLEWATVVAKVEPANFDCSNLEWTFTPSDDALGFESKKVSDSEYLVRVAAYADGGKVAVTVKDKNSDLSDTAEIQVAENAAPEIPAKIVRLTAPDYLTESTLTWGMVTAEVVPDGTGEYDYANLIWKFTPSEAFESEVEYEKFSDSQYRLRFKSYKEGASVTIEVTDAVGGKFVQKTIRVAQRPASGVSSLTVSPESVSLFVGDDPVKLAVTCDPVSYDQSLLLLESSDTDVVEIEGDKIVPVAAGQAVVKVWDSISEISDECVVTVLEPVTDADVRRIVLETSRLELRVGDLSYQLNATCYDEAGNEVKGYAGLVWSASQDINSNGLSFDVVEVSSQGIVTPKAEGRTTITVAVESNQAVKANCEVVVHPKAVVVEKLWLSPAENTIDVGDKYTLMVTSEPEFSTVDDKTITYVSSNPEVATVAEDGLVKGVSYGEAVITATAASGVSATSKVIVQKKQGEEEEKDFQIILNIDNEKEGQNVKLPQFETLNINVTYTNGYVPSESRWESSDPSLAVVTGKDGFAEVYAVYDGMMTDDEKKSVTITHYSGTRSAAKTIDITRALPKSVEFVGLPENNTIYLGETLGPDFGVVVSPAQATQQVTYWGDVAIYSVANGSTVAHQPGLFHLAARASCGNVSVDASVYITVIPRLVEGGTLSNSTLSLETGKDAELLIDFTPVNNENYDYNVAWATSDPEVAIVDNGKVTAVASGTATITATLSNGDVLSCEVTVTEPAPVLVSVGDYYYSDGTTSAELDASKTVIGVVFSVDNPTQMGDTKLLADHPEATHGLVVALKETASIQWQASSSDVGQWLIENTGYNYLKDTDRKCGYSNTLGLRAYNAACALENKVLVADCAPDIELGSETSGWYLPSYAELNMLFSYEQSTRSAMISNGAIAERIVAAGGTPFSIERSGYDDTRIPSGEARKDWPDGANDAPTYWSSTESSGSSIWATGVHFLYGGVTNKSKTGKSYYIARYIFAF